MIGVMSFFSSSVLCAHFFGQRYAYLRILAVFEKVSEKAEELE